MPPHGGLNCSVSRWKTNCLLVKIFTASLRRYWLPLLRDLGCLLMEILVAFLVTPREELLSHHGKLHFSTSFLCYDRGSCVFIYFYFWRTCYNVLVVFWIDPLGSIPIGGVGVTVGL